MLIALPVPVTSYSTDSVAPGLADSLGGVVALGVGTGTTGGSGRSDVVGEGVREVDVDGSGIGGGATTVSCFELLTTTRAITRPTTSNTATAAAAHSHRGDLGFCGPSGGSPGGYGWPYCPVPYWPVVYGS